jgi:sugar phosphate permease
MSQNTASIETKTIAGKPTKFRWVVAGLIFLVYTVAAADRANMGMALPFIRSEFQMSNTEAGALVSLFLLAYAIAQIPSGFAFSKFGVQKIFSLAMIMTSIFTGLIGTSSSPLMMKIYRFGLGLAEGPLPIGITSTINNWFPPREKGFTTGLFLSAAKFGPVLVPPLCALIIQMSSWHYIFYFFALPGIFLSIIWYILVKNHPSESPYCSPAELKYIESEQSDQKTVVQKRPYTLKWLDQFIRARKADPLDTNSRIFRSWDIWGSTLGYFFMMGITNVLLAWIPTYLVTVKHFTIMKMGFVASAPWVGAVVGNMLGGWFSDKVINKRRKPLMMMSSLSTAFMMYALISAPNDPFFLGTLLFMTGILMNFGFSAYMVYPMGLTTKKTFPIAGSVINTGGQLGGACAPLITGMILDAYSWDAVFMFLAASSFMSLLIISTITEPVEDPLNT